MASVTIRNLDDKVVTILKERARAHERSLAAELRVLLTRAARGPDRSDLRMLAESIAAMTPGTLQTDSADLIRENRDGRNDESDPDD